MEFLVIVAALILHRLISDLGWLHQDGWYRNWVGSLRSRKAPLTKYVVSLALPVMVVTILTVIIHHFWGGVSLFLFSLLGLLYVIGRGDLNAQLQTLEEDFARNDMQAAYHDASVFNVAHHESNAESGGEFHLDLLESVSYRYFEHYFPVIFWFALLGVPGALLYRLAEIHADLELDEGRERNIAERWLWMMEWIPARLLGLSFALVGNFACCIHRWKECLFCPVRSSRQVLGHYVIGALSADVETADAAISVAELEMVKRLFYRALTMWVCIIALLVVF